MSSDNGSQNKDDNFTTTAEYNNDKNNYEYSSSSYFSVSSSYEAYDIITKSGKQMLQFLNISNIDKMFIY